MRRLPVSLATLLLAAPVFASEAEEHHASVSELIFPFLNFLLFLFLIYKFVIPMARDYFKNRRAAIAAAINEADEAKRRGETLLADFRSRLARLGDELRSIREELRADAERAKAKLLEEAAEAARRIKSDADFLAEQEVRLARAELKREIVERAAATAERLVRENLTPADQKRMVGEFLTEVEAAR
ncbi:MAG TPA: ATP synthase F0 subunit B [Candidatus Binatia bacterium]|nr:ATP synthase F0 subunit B [Candidatus Binatia bacterium]